MIEKLENVTIVDVRTPEEFAGEHFPNALNIPLDEVTQRIEAIRKMKRPIIFYCRSGNRSGMAVSIVKQNGINDAVNGGGLDDLKLNMK